MVPARSWLSQGSVAISKHLSNELLVVANHSLKETTKGFILAQRHTAMAKSAKNHQFKGLLKTAIVEAIEENKELVQAILEDAIENAYLKRAIKEGKRTKRVSRERIFSILAGHS